MPATMTFKTVKKQALLLPQKQKSKLTEALLQDEYEQQCWDAAKQASQDYKAGKTTARPAEDVMRDIKAYSKKLSRK